VWSIVVTGVSGSGKTTVASRLAERLSFDFIDSDWLHSPDDRAKMASAHALSDDDRLPWLRETGLRIRADELARRSSVTACSALKRQYRDVLRDFVPDAYFVLLDGPTEIVAARVNARPSTFMPASLLDSQYAILEPLAEDERGLVVAITSSPDAIIEVVVRALALERSRS